MRKKALKIFLHFLHASFFMFIFLVSNHTVFLVQFGRRGSCNFSYLKNSFKIELELKAYYIKFIALIKKEI